MDQDKYDQLEASVGKEAAYRCLSSEEAGTRIVEGKARPLDLVTNLADGLLCEAYVIGHTVKVAAEAVGHAIAQAVSPAAPTKPLETPPPAAQEPQGKGK